MKTTSRRFRTFGRLILGNIMNIDTHNVQIIESYKDYRPPINVVKTVDRLLKGIPNRYLGNLHKVIIIDSNNLSNKYRKKKVRSSGKTLNYKDCYGFYYEAWRGRPAYIELIIDNIFKFCPKVLAKIPILYNYLISETLYHELGHHIQRYHKPIFKEKENVADSWSSWLLKYFFIRRYWYLAIILYIPIKLIKLFILIIKYLKAKSTGWAKRGEIRYNE